MACARLVPDNGLVASPTARRARTAYLSALALLVVALLAGCLTDPRAGRGTLAPTPAAVSTGMPSTAVPSTAVPSTAVPSTAVPSTGTKPGVDPESGLAWVAESALPRAARQTLARIAAGGPFPFPRNDDQVFGNRERLLPAKATGYYREYTVLTAGADDRGPRRIVAGRGGERYYTEDHYRSFRRIREDA